MLAKLIKHTELFPFVFGIKGPQIVDHKGMGNIQCKALFDLDQGPNLVHSHESLILISILIYFK